MDILSILEGVYLMYMYIFFKTTYSIHHPFEYMVVKTDLWKHPINTGSYENKICNFGKYMSVIGAILFIYRGFGNPVSSKVSKVIIITWLMVSFMSNINAFIYVLPIVAMEILYNKLTLIPYE